MRLSLVVLIFLVSFSIKSRADEVRATPNVKHPGATATQKGSIQITCSDISDSFCKKLWDKDHRGNMKVFDGQILMGNSDKSDLPQVTKMDDRALIDSVPRLPPDLKEVLTPIILEIEEAYKHETSSDKWFRELGLLNYKLNVAIENLADANVEAAHPELKAILDDDRSPSQALLYATERRRLKDELTKAKYAENENWLRVNVAFKQALADLKRSVESFRIPAGQKNEMIKKLDSVKLSLPFYGDDTTFRDSGCASTEVNAYYIRETNMFTFCAGTFNGFQSVSALTFLIRHEISHSNDSDAISMRLWRQNSPLAKVLEKLEHSKGPVFECKEWSKYLNTTLKPKSKIKLLNINTLDKFYSCLNPRESLNAFTTENVRGAVRQIVAGNFSEFSTANRFLDLAQPSFDRYDVKKINDVYLRPDVDFIKTFKRTDQTWSRSVILGEVFTQALSCQIEKASGNVKNGEARVTKVSVNSFRAAIEETRMVWQAMHEDYFSYCGQACGELAPMGLGNDPSENNADLFAFDSMPSFLENVPKEDRLEAAGLSVAFFCGRPSAATSAPELATVEKRYSMEPHQENRSRRISIFTKEVAKTIGCKVDPEAKGFSECKP